MSVPWPKIVLFGDSLSQNAFSEDGCWGSLLANKVVRRCDVISRGFSGYNTRMCKAVLPLTFPSFGEPLACVTVFLGANDSNLGDKNPQQHVPLEEYEENLNWIVKFLEEKGVQRSKVILISPPTFNGQRWAAFRDLPEPSKDNDTTRMYAKACIRAAKALGCDFVDLFSIMETKHSGTWDELLCDGLHLSPKGSQVLFNAVWPLVEKRIQKWPELIFPVYGDMDRCDPGRTIKKWMEGNLPNGDHN